MEEKQLRKYDFVTAIGLILFSFWELTQALQMPMKKTYNGVQNDWYVSPALLPLIIGLGILLLGIILLVNAIKTGGAASFLESVKEKKKFKVSNQTIRALTVVLGLASFIYLFIPNIDFFLSITLFLFFVCAAFYLDNDEFRNRMTIQFLIASVILIILLATGLDDLIKGIFKYNLDILTLFYIIYLNIYSRIKSRKIELSAKKLKQVTIVSIIVPLILCPLFRYFLLVPLPVEGGIIKLMNLLYYTIR
ncbi:MAG: tripartite tricarboxylate transporter TctB family protein [Spirochaetaceae bacterium]|jgi:uncharacterized membrane protein|nr:tripartite tricarboxylate transporter TctB family protein [Spirochaetaceae bacterium]